jgi:hypothetical protein
MNEIAHSEITSSLALVEELEKTNEGKQGAPFP